MQNTLKFRYSEENILQSFLPFLDSHNYCYCSFMFTTFQQIIRQKLIPSSVIRIKEWMLISYKKLKFTKDISQSLFHLFQTNYRCFSLPNENAVKLEPFFIYVYLQMYTFEKYMSPKQSSNLEPSLKERNSNVDIYEVFRHCLDDLLWLVSDNDSGMLTATHVNHLAVFLCEEKNFNSLNIAKSFPFWFASDSTTTATYKQQASPRSKKNSFSKSIISSHLVRDERMLDPELSAMMGNVDQLEDETISEERTTIMHDEEEELFSTSVASTSPSSLFNNRIENSSRNNHFDPSQSVELNIIKNYILENLERGKLPHHLLIRNIYSNYVFYNQESATTDTYFELSDISDQSYICILQPHIQTICVKNCRDCTLVFGVVRNIIHVTNCHHVNIICITNAIKITFSSNCTFYMCCNNRPILFTSNSNLKFAPYNTTFEYVTKQLQHSGIDPTINYFSEPFVVDLESIHQLQQQQHHHLHTTNSNHQHTAMDTSNQSPSLLFSSSPTIGHLSSSSSTSSPSSNTSSSSSPSSSPFSTTSPRSQQSTSPSPATNSPSNHHTQQHLMQLSPPPSPNSNTNGMMKSKTPPLSQQYPTVFTILDPHEFHLHFIPFENYHKSHPNHSSLNSNNNNNSSNNKTSGVFTISEILKRIPSPLPREYQLEIQNRTKSIANLFDHIKHVAQDISQKSTISSTAIQTKIMEHMNRKFREWLSQSGHDKEYKVFLTQSGQSVSSMFQRNVARKRNNSGFQMSEDDTLPSQKEDE